MSSGLSMSLGVETSRHLEFIRKCCECSLRSVCVGVKSVEDGIQFKLVLSGDFSKTHKK